MTVYMRSIAARTVFVTGTASGMGRATVRLFAAEGADVIATDRDETGLKAPDAEHERILALPLDVADAAAIAQVVIAGPEHFDGAYCA